MRDQDEYSMHVDKMYRDNNPLFVGRARTKDTFADEILQIGDVIHHCLIIGNSRLLHDYIIDPINANPSALTFPDYLQNYIDILQEYQQDARTETARWYWELVISTIIELNIRKNPPNYAAVR